MPSTRTEIETYTLGAWGVLCAQFAHYLSLNKRDSIWMKLFVAGLALMTTLKTLQSLAMMWIQNVTLFGDREAASNIWHKHWVWYTNLMLEAITAFYVQMFFSHRLWHRPFTYSHVGKKPVSMQRLGSACDLGRASESFKAAAERLRTSFKLFEGSVLQQSSTWAPTKSPPSWSRRNAFEAWMWLGSSCVILDFSHPLGRDTSWSCAVRRPAFDRKHDILFASPAAICALINFAANMRISVTTLMPALVMFDFIANTVLPQLYAWSAMWTLNSREEICLAAESCSYTVNLLQTSAGGSSVSETVCHQHQDTLVVKGQSGRLDSPPESMA
ncbi:hypothetical protein DFH08DRAFT_1041241 [Mycena albidolilacea]|uniref:Uncharacterized protein n=1 Tax=Mycena albidolilacea TaxID=1033008 RepID=A0AAD7EDE9_9AGAR|nr:hypothetical protein DFH08DRAFT_1041241 [Mycena albidolilacea]